MMKVCGTGDDISSQSSTRRSLEKKRKRNWFYMYVYSFSRYLERLIVQFRCTFSSEFGLFGY